MTSAILRVVSPDMPPKGERWHRQILGHEYFAPAQWRRRVALWSGGILVGLAAIAFARGSDIAIATFQSMVRANAWLPFVVTPAVFAAIAALTSGKLRQTRGSGIPQVIAAIELEDRDLRHRLLSVPVTLGKMALTLFGLAGGASIGREGPTIHVGAGLMYWVGRRMGFTDPKALSRFILAGGGAGIAAAFNAPLAGIVFAIEELAGSFEQRVSGIILTAVIFAGVVSLGLLGDYAYFGRVDAHLQLGQGTLAVLLCGIGGGIGGGVFVRLIMLSPRGPLARIEACRRHWPILFAGVCGLLLAVLGMVSGTSVFGTGYDEARGLIQATHGGNSTFWLFKVSANVLSYWAGIPGGIFSPALAVGAGMGHALAALLPGIDQSAVALLGMAAFLAGVTQTPLTAAVISLELTANHSMVIPLLAVTLLARGLSSLVCHVPVYRAFADRIIVEHRQSKSGT